jgi:hypothetical protein
MEKLLLHFIHAYLLSAVFIYSAFLLLIVPSLIMGKFGVWIIMGIISGMVGINIESMGNKFLPIQIAVFIAELVLYSALMKYRDNERRSFSELYKIIISYKILMLSLAFVTHKKVYIFCSGFLLPILFNLFKSYVYSQKAVQNFSFIVLTLYTSMLIYMIRSKTVKEVFVK